VLEGVLSYNGMASFAEVVSEPDVEAIQVYIVSEQHRLRSDKPALE